MWFCYVCKGRKHKMKIMSIWEIDNNWSLTIRGLKIVVFGRACGVLHHKSAFLNNVKCYYRFELCLRFVSHPAKYNHHDSSINRANESKCLIYIKKRKKKNKLLDSCKKKKKITVKISDYIFQYLFGEMFNSNQTWLTHH